MVKRLGLSVFIRFRSKADILSGIVIATVGGAGVADVEDWALYDANDTGHYSTASNAVGNAASVQAVIPPKRLATF